MRGPFRGHRKKRERLEIEIEMYNNIKVKLEYWKLKLKLIMVLLHYHADTSTACAMRPSLPCRLQKIQAQPYQVVALAQRCTLTVLDFSKNELSQNPE